MRILYFDYIRAVAIFFVVLIHVTAPTLLTEDGFIPGWEICLSMNALSRIGVPLFFMISGALFLNPDKNIGFSYMRKKIQRIVVAFIVFSLLYSIIWFVAKKHFDFDVNDVVCIFLPRFLNGWYHLWFLQSLVVLYLLTPVLRLIIIDKSICLYITLILFVVCSLFPFLGHFLNYKPFIGELLDNMSFRLPQYALFYILGYICSQLRYKIKSRCLFVCGGGIILLLEIVFDIINSLQIGHPVILWSGYLSPLVVVYSCIFFLYIKEVHPSSSYKLVQFLSANSFGIYLIHVFFIEGLIRILFFPLYGMQVWLSPLISVSIVGLCSFLTMLLRKIRLMDIILR